MTDFEIFSLLVSPKQNTSKKVLEKKKLKGKGKITFKNNSESQINL